MNGPETGEDSDEITDRFWAMVKDGLQQAGFSIVNQKTEADAVLDMATVIYLRNDYMELARVIVTLSNDLGNKLWERDYWPEYKDPAGLINSPEDAITVRAQLAVRDVVNACSLN